MHSSATATKCFAPTSSTSAATNKWEALGTTSISLRLDARSSGKIRRRATHRLHPTNGGSGTTNPWTPRHLKSGAQPSSAEFRPGKDADGDARERWPVFVCRLNKETGILNVHKGWPRSSYYWRTKGPSNRKARTADAKTGVLFYEPAIWQSSHAAESAQRATAICFRPFLYQVQQAG